LRLRFCAHSRICSDAICIEEFCHEFTREVNRLRIAASAAVTASERELRRVQAAIGKLVQALKDGVPASIVEDPLIALEVQQTELCARIDRATQPPALLHPHMADLYRER
jgi:site-specific DNA recombinase